MLGIVVTYIFAWNYFLDSDVGTWSRGPPPLDNCFLPLTISDVTPHLLTGIYNDGFGQYKAIQSEKNLKNS